LTCPITVSSFLAMIGISRWPIITSVADHTKTRFISCYDPVEKHPIFVSSVDQITTSAHAIITLVLRQDAGCAG
jgi:hypothetical protein